MHLASGARMPVITPAEVPAPRPEPVANALLCRLPALGTTLTILWEGGWQMSGRLVHVIEDSGRPTHLEIRCVQADATRVRIVDIRKARALWWHERHTPADAEALAAQERSGR
jgi:formamidopyrimidine-DNA glycosylase